MKLTSFIFAKQPIMNYGYLALILVIKIVQAITRKHLSRYKFNSYPLIEPFLTKPQLKTGVHGAYVPPARIE